MDDGKAHFETLVVDDEPTEGVVGTSEALCALAPVGLLAELTHRCPLQCSYCSNPLELERVNKELTTDEWFSAMTQAGDMGILQVHLSGGEPTARKDLEQIVEAAAKAGLYTNLITAAVTLNRPRLEGLDKLGLDHVQISFQDVDEENAERISAYPKASRRSSKSPAGSPSSGCRSPSTRRSTGRISTMSAAISSLRFKLGAQRLEIAHAQYYGWAYLNRAALIPTYEDTLAVDRARRARARAAEGSAHHRHGGAGLLRQTPEALHGRLGQGLHEHHARPARFSPVTPPRPSPS